MNISVPYTQDKQILICNYLIQIFFFLVIEYYRSKALCVPLSHSIPHLLFPERSTTLNLVLVVTVHVFILLLHLYTATNNITLHVFRLYASGTIL